MRSWIENELIELINSDQFRLSIAIQFQFKIFQFNSNSIHAELNWIDYQFQLIRELIWALVAYNDLWPITSRSFGLGLENRVRSVASTVPDGVFPYLVQMITTMRRRVACDDLWPWPISSRSFGLDLENCVRSVASAVLDGFFLYWHKWSLSLEGVACYVFFRIWKFEFWQIFKFFSALTLKKNLQFSMDSFHI